MRRLLIISSALWLFLSPAQAQRTDSPAAKRGGLLYGQYCASCHQLDGNGVPRLIPPLVSTDYVSGDKTRLIRILLEGLNERILVQGEEYYSPMAAFDYLSDGQLSDILTYVRARFGKGASPVTEKEVRLQRAKGKK